mgnify:CR=1 FL=1
MVAKLRLFFCIADNHAAFFLAREHSVYYLCYLLNISHYAEP